LAQPKKEIEPPSFCQENSGCLADELANNFDPKNGPFFELVKVLVQKTSKNNVFVSCWFSMTILDVLSHTAPFRFFSVVTCHF
jgi:hypothetical protein